MIEEFNKYVANYDCNNPKIKLKYDHSFRVMKLSEEYAKKLNFSIEDIYLAKVIGLLHDIGRFEQIKVYDTHNDYKSVDHADYSVEQLFNKGEIRNFVKDCKNDDIIRLAIKNHNKLIITGVNDERAMMHAKLIRDSDKVDILYIITCLDEISVNDKDLPISPKVLESIKLHKSVNTKEIENPNDHICCWFAFPFDINNDICLKDVDKYISLLYNKLTYKENFKEVYEEVKKYIEERIG